jgi:phage gp36-like protein
MPPVTQYAQPSDLTAFGISSDALDAMDPSDVEKSLAGSSAIIDSALRSRYKLPFTRVGLDVTRCCCILSVYDLMVVRGYNPSAGPDDNLLLRCEAERKWLTQCAAGVMTPDVSDSSGDVLQVLGTRAKVTTSSSRGWSARSNGNRGPGYFQGD